MSWEDTWKLPEPTVDRAALRTAVELLGQRHGLTSELTEVPGGVSVKLGFPVARVLELVRELDPDEPVLALPPSRQAEELERTWDPAAAAYQVTLSALDGEDSATITITSDEADNRRIWAAAHTLFRAVAEALCAEPAEDELMALWDSSAVLKPRDQS